MEINVSGDEPKELQLGKEEEKDVIGLAFEQAEFFSVIMPFLDSKYFQQTAPAMVFTVLEFSYKKYGHLISREMCRDMMMKSLTADDDHKEILGLIDRKLDPRAVPIIMEELSSWAKKRTIGQIYSRETIDAFENGNFEEIEKIIEDAQKITNINNSNHFFFREFQELFVKDATDRFTTGFKSLDNIMQGGPARGETFCWMAPTGKGKSIALPNVGASNLRQGSNILHVTCEMTWKQTALRYMALLSQVPYKQRFDPKSQSQITQVLARIKDSYNSELIIVDFPPDEISVDVIAAKVDQLRKLHGIQIDVIIIDYLELLLSRNPYFNRDEYLKQKRVGTEIDRLGKKTNTAVFTATQTRRSGNEQNQDKGAKNTGAKLIDIADVAESYGKTMPMHYIVTINQTKGEYESGRQGGRLLDLGDNSEQVPNTNAACRLYVVKNRNGRQFITINARINYETMTMKEADNMSSDTIRTKDNV